MKTYVLEAFPVAKYYTLWESLNWVADKEYSIGWEFECEPDGTDLLDEMFERSRAASPILKDILSTPVLEEEESTPSLPDNLLEHNEQEQKEIVEDWKKDFERKCLEKVAKDNYALSPFKSELFIKLRNGNIPAYGQIRAKLKDGISIGQWNQDESWEEIEYKDGSLRAKNLDKIIAGETINGFQKIPADFWVCDGIEWESNYARSTLGCYHWIFIPSEALFKHFPQSEMIPFEVQKCGDFLLLDGRNYNLNRKTFGTTKGRPPLYNWPEFHAEVTRYILAENGQLPKQTSLEQYMQAWCEQNWKKVPSHGSIHAQISPHYTVLPKIKKAAS